MKPVNMTVLLMRAQEELLHLRMCAWMSKLLGASRWTVLLCLWITNIRWLFLVGCDLC